MTGYTADNNTSSPKQKRNREESTQRILKAALEVFSEVGYDAATTKIISQRAGLNESLIQRYFQGKFNLLVEVTHSSMEAMRLETPPPPAATPEEEIYNFLINKLEHDSQNQGFLKVLFSRLLIDPKVRTELKKRQGEMPPDFFLKNRLVAFQKKGQIKDGIDIDTLIQSLIAQSISVGLFERIFFEKDIETCKAQFRQFARNITKGILPQ
ncbi:MAG: TetR/AcrR family transcriptional regulator [Candidatus Omnitrophota bacterium]